MRNPFRMACLIAGLSFVAGCVNARAPDVYINTGPQPAAVDSSRVPDPQTLEEARAELAKAYQQIRYLEHQNEKCERKLEQARQRGDDYKRKSERLDDKRDD